MTPLPASSRLSLDAGNYALWVELSDGSSYAANVSVRGYLSTTELRPNSYAVPVTLFAQNVYQYILPTNSGHLTYDSLGGISGVNIPSELSQRPIIGGRYVDANHMILVSTDESESSIYASMYDIASQSVNSLGVVSESAADTGIYYGENIIYLTHPDSPVITSLSKTGVSSVALGTDVTFSTNNALPLLAIEDGVVATISGNDYSLKEETANHGVDISTVQPETLTIYPAADFSVKTVVPLGVRGDITGISLSPDARHLVVIGVNSASSYDTKTGEQEFVTPINNTGGNSLVWRDDSSFIYQFGIGGLYLANLDKKQSFSIIDNKLLRITDLSDVINDTLYFSAFSNQTANSGASNPNAYTIDLKDITLGVVGYAL
jgi:hypothetical protein